MGSFTSYGVYAKKIASLTDRDDITQPNNRYVNDSAAVFPCDGQFGREMVMYSRRFKNPAPGTQKAVLIKIGDSQEDIIALRAQKAAVGDQVICIPVDGDPNYVIALTDMQFFTNGCFEERGNALNPSYPEPSRVYAPLGWDMQNKRSGDCPFTIARTERSTENIMPGQNKSNYQLKIWAKGKGFYAPPDDNEPNPNEVVATQTGPLRDMRYLSFVTCTQKKSLNPFRGSGGLCIKVNDRWYDLYVGSRDLPGEDTEDFNCYYVEVDLVTAIAYRAYGANNESNRRLAQTLLHGNGTYGFYYHHPGGNTTVHEVYFDMVDGTR
jgi:hypothetical protein